MTRKEIVKVCEASREKASKPGFAQTPLNPKHVKRLEELKAVRPTSFFVSRQDTTYQRNEFGPDLK